MTLKIKTKDTEIEYQDECSQLEESTKKRLIEIIDKIYERQIEITLSKQIPNPSIPTGIIYDNPKTVRPE